MSLEILRRTSELLLSMTYASLFTIDGRLLILGYMGDMSKASIEEAGRLSLQIAMYHWEEILCNLIT